MDSQLQKRIIAVSCLAFLMVTAWFVHTTPFPLNAYAAQHISSLFLLIILLMVITWFTVGSASGGVVCLGAVLLASFAAMKFSDQRFFAYGLGSVGASVIAHIFYQVIRENIAQHRVAIERLNEDVNLLRAGRQHKQSQQAAFEKRFERIWLLRTITENMGQILSVADSTQFIVREAFRLVGKTETSLLFLVDEENQELALTVSWGYDGHPTVKSKKGDIFDQWVLKQRQSLIVNDVKQDFRFDVDRIEDISRPFRSLVAAPLISERRVVGIIRLDHPEPNRYSADDLRLLTIFAGISAVALSNTILFEKIRKLAIHDGLTNLFLQRYFKERLVEELAKSFTLNQACSVIVIDIDDFKDYNDTYGHIAGDIVLKEIASLLKVSQMTQAVNARYGGEEFAVILPGYYKSQALEYADSLRKTIAGRMITLRREPTKVTVSVGVATFPEDAVSSEDLFRAADQAMYQAKKTGKNRVCTTG